MKRFWPCLLLLAIAQPARAGGDDAPCYGPMKRWHGVGYKFGYEDRIEKDGSWRVDAAVHGHGDAIDMALYRVAERAWSEGYRYVFLLGGNGSRSPGIDAATVYARPSHEGVPPLDCRSKKITSCYTADVAEVLRILGGPGGTRPGVPIADHRDELGREVFLSGYCTGGIATLVPGGVARSQVTTIVLNRPTKIPWARASSASTPATLAIARVAVPVTATRTPAAGGVPIHGAVLTADDRFAQELKKNQPVRKRDAQQGWTISD